MDRIDRILRCAAFRKNLDKINAVEKDRIFCRHDMSHFLDVARIASIISLEEGLDIDRELIYGAALLHDIGKHRQYTDGIPHEKASVIIASDILRDCGFDDEETHVIIKAIDSHRDDSVALEASLRGVLYRADKASRPCYSCAAEGDCNWKESKKNHQILY